MELIIRTEDGEVIVAKEVSFGLDYSRREINGEGKITDGDGVYYILASYSGHSKAVTTVEDEQKGLEALEDIYSVINSYPESTVTIDFRDKEMVVTTVEEVEWIDKGEDYESNISWWKCSICGETVALHIGENQLGRPLIDDYNCCPYCGNPVAEEW